jgi:HAD superfamily hydrolase (TIGR01458 family)
MNITNTSIKAVLLDIYGTVFIEGLWLPGAKETIAWLLENELQIRFITNTTLKNRRMIHEIFLRNGLDIPKESFFIPACAARNWYLANPPKRGILPLVHSSQLEDMTDIPLVDRGPVDYVLVGDMGNEWNIEIMNRALSALMDGATLTAFQQNPYWLAADGNRLDSGAFVAALEYGSGKKCQHSFGKPNELFFKMALADAGVAPEQAIMVGDELAGDIVGAQRCGIRGVLLKSGKYDINHKELGESAHVVLDGIGKLREWLESL